MIDPNLIVSLNFFKSFEIDEVREFEIKDKLGNVQFKKTGKNWFLSQNGDRVSSEKLKIFINLKDITKFDLVLSVKRSF